MKRQHFPYQALYAAIACFGGGMPAVADTSPSASFLEEIIVTARRRDENLQDVPDAVTAFSETVIQNAGISSVDDAVALSPSIDNRNDQQPGVYTLTVRGVSTVRNGQPPVAFVVDGVTLPSSNSLTQELFDIQQIEILKGPQGALYGRNSIGGAINVTTKKPSDVFEGKVQAGFGKGDTYKVSGSVSGPLADNTFFRISGLYKDSDGLLDNETLHEPADWEETSAVRGRLLVEATEALTLDFRASYYKTEQGSTYYVPLGIATPPPLGGLSLNSETGEILGDYPSAADVESSMLSFKLDWDTDLGTLTWISSYDELEETNDQEIDWTASSYLEGLLLTDVEGLTQEIRFTSPEDQELRWFAGAFYQQIDRTRGTNAFINTSALGGDLDPANKTMLAIAQEKLTQDWKSYAVFGQVNYDITERLELTLAARYDVFESDETQTIFGVDAADLYGRDSQFQPKASLSFDINPDMMVYLTAAKGWRPGGFNLPNRLDVTNYDEEKLDNFELGFKGTWLDGKLITNMAVYHIDYDKQQYFLLTTAEDTPESGPVQLLVNGEKSTIRGFDIEITARPIENLDISAGYGIVDGELDKISGNIPTQFPQTQSGNKLPNTAANSANLSVQYTWPINDKNIIARVDYSRLGKTYWTLDNVMAEDPYELVDARLSLEWDRYRVTAVAENIFDEEYYSQVFDQRWSGFVTDVGWPSKPSYYGLEVSVEF